MSENIICCQDKMFIIFLVFFNANLCPSFFYSEFFCINVCTDTDNISNILQNGYKYINSQLDKAMMMFIKNILFFFLEDSFVVDFIVIRPVRRLNRKNMKTIKTEHS